MISKRVQIPNESSEENLEGIWKAAGYAEKYEEFLEYKDRYLEAEDRIMEFDGDIIITDPCYLSHNMSNDERKNFECCDISSHGIIGIESNTYYGDWGLYYIRAWNEG